MHFSIGRIYDIKALFEFIHQRVHFIRRRLSVIIQRYYIITCTVIITSKQC